MNKELAKKYDPAGFEDRLYSFWIEKGYFTPTRDPGKPHFTVVIPPPNITGQLHMGHALDETLQDILVRYKRMCGYSTLWLPGTDHASIATEAKIVEQMREEGLSKEDVGRDGFLERAWAWNDKYGGRIINQLKKLGSSCDWTRTRFTLDEGCSRAVREVFLRLYEKGLIYRGNRIVNWCPHCRTTISDAEVEYEDQAGFFWHIRYPVKDSDEFVELATTRPETLLGDTAVAVNPSDERYKHLVGKTVILPLVGREIPVVADDYVETDFGTGVVKITPAHDPNDFEVGARHGLPVINVMTDDARITDDYPAYAGMDRYEARRKIVEDLEKGGYLVSVEPYTHSVGTCYRCGNTVEPRVSLQWFVSMKPLAGPAIDSVKNGDIKFVPDRFSKNYFHWMENIRDWCISRQLWWGHRIPAFYCDDCGETVVTLEPSAVCPKCGKPMRQDEDTLDTWFSSALWPFSTLGWPDETEDLKYFFPTSVLVTGYDIITFWVSRMIFSSLEYTGKAPFDTVLIHGLVRDAQGRKMSKSLGNGIDPLEVISVYGADALRFTLATGNSPGNDMRFSKERVEASRNFANKIWNAARFVHMNLNTECDPDKLDVSELMPEDRWVLSVYNRTVSEVRDALDRCEIGIAVGKLYDFLWDIFCDWYIELVKPRLFGKTGGDTGAAAQRTLIYVLSGTLKLLHPFMPFITEEIWQSLPHKGESICIASYPEADEKHDFPQDEEKINAVIDAIRAVRNRRAEMNVPPSRKTHIFIRTPHRGLFADSEEFFVSLASAAGVSVIDGEPPEGCVSIVSGDNVLYLPVNEMVDVAAERARLTKELENAEKQISLAEFKLKFEKFVSRAPEQGVAAERARLEKNTALKAGLVAEIAKLK